MSYFYLLTLLSRNVGLNDTVMQDRKISLFSILKWKHKVRMVP